jgi:hypothetical protein
MIYKIQIIEKIAAMVSIIIRKEEIQNKNIFNIA